MQDDAPSGEWLGPYRIQDVIGRGGMGVVYRARQQSEHLDRTVALKVLAPELTKDESFRHRFVRESRLAAELDHENIVPVYDAGQVEGRLYIAMRYVDGTDLASLLRREHRLEPARALILLNQVARALDAAHHRGLVHRDVKPGNILISLHEGETGEHVYLADFGLTKRRASQSGLTMPGHFLGTLDYVAPEQIRGEPADGAADQYAFTCVLFHCLSGSPPFVFESDVALLNAHINQEAPSLYRHRPSLGADVDDVISRGMAKAPSDRYANCRDVILAMRHALALDTPAAAFRPAVPVTAPASIEAGPLTPRESTPPPPVVPSGSESSISDRRGIPATEGIGMPVQMGGGWAWWLLLAAGGLLLAVAIGATAYFLAGGTAPLGTDGSPSAANSASPSADEAGAEAMAALLAIVPAGVAESCMQAGLQASNGATAGVSCHTGGVSQLFWYLYPSADALQQAYSRFAPTLVSMGTSCADGAFEGAYTVGTEAGNQRCFLATSSDGPAWIIWTVPQANVLGIVNRQDRNLPALQSIWQADLVGPAQGQ